MTGSPVCCIVLPCNMGKLDKFDIVFKNPDGVCVSGNPLCGSVVLELSGKLKVHGQFTFKFKNYLPFCKNVDNACYSF